MKCTSPVIVALDFSELKPCLELVSRLDPSLCRLKVGKELYSALGPSIVEKLSVKFDVFLDLKFHDIPNTVAKACSNVCSLGAWMVNVHAAGGRAMLMAAREALGGLGRARPLLTAVTVLTSLQSADLLEMGVTLTAKDYAEKLAKLAYDCGLDGVVCSPHEVAGIKAATCDDFKVVTPGIRLTETSDDDQQRIMTPKQAIASGSDYLVIGRPITQASSPSAALESIVHSLAC